MKTKDEERLSTVNLENNGDWAKQKTLPFSSKIEDVFVQFTGRNSDADKGEKI